MCCRQSQVDSKRCWRDRQNLQTAALAAIAPLIVIVFLACTRTLFLPNLKNIMKERQTAWELLVDVPKSTCVNLFTLTTETEKLEEKYKNNRLMVPDKQQNVVKLIIWYLVMMIIISLLSAVSLVLMFTLSNSRFVANIAFLSST